MFAHFFKDIKDPIDLNRNNFYFILYTLIHKKYFVCVCVCVVLLELYIQLFVFAKGYYAVNSGKRFIKR